MGVPVQRRGLRFYERHGFTAVEWTDGDNEEGEPDVRMVWRRPGRDLPGPVAQTWTRASTAATTSAIASAIGTPFFCSPLR